MVAHCCFAVLTYPCHIALFITLYGVVFGVVDVTWCHVVLFDVSWCYLMLFDVIWCYLMPFGVKWCYLMLFGVI